MPAAPAARNDLRDIWRYFVGVASPEIADRLLRDIHRASERARRRPLTWRARDEVMPGLRSILVHPYVVFYRMTGETVEIVRVLHQRRNLAKVFSKSGPYTNVRNDETHSPRHGRACPGHPRL